MIQVEEQHQLETSPINTSTSSTNSISSSSSSSSSSNGSYATRNANDVNNNKLVNSSTMPNGVNGNGVGGLHRTASTNSLSSQQQCTQAELEAYEEFNGQCAGTSQTNLIVNYLPQNMTQDEIKELFSSIGPVESCKLIKDKLTGQSLGYAFVNYLSQDDAANAINKLNGMHLQNKTIKVSLARPSSESIKGANLYVCGLHKDFCQTELENMFRAFGTIISSKILTDPKTGVSKGVGFVRFDQRHEAETAIVKLNGTMPENVAEPLVVKFANSPTTAKTVMGIPLAPFMPITRGFYQPFRTSSNASYRYSPMGGYESSLLQHQHQASMIAAPHPPPPAHLSTASLIAAAAAAAAASNNPQVVPPQMTQVMAMPASAITPPSMTSSTSLVASPPPANGTGYSTAGWCIFVYNLGPETDERLLWELFGPFGAVLGVKIIRDPQTLKCKGFGFVTMVNYDDAASAIHNLNGINLQNRILQVSFKTNSNKQMF